MALDLRDRLLRADPPYLRDLIAAPAPLCGDRRFDALVAAAVEDACARASVAAPSWTGEAERFVRPMWYLSDVRDLHWWELTSAPAAFIRHGVLAAETELASM